MRLANVALIGSLALAGCATTGGTTGGGTVPGDFLTEVQALAVGYCGFQPVINTVLEIVATFGGPGAVAGEAWAEKIAAGICGAVTAGGTSKMRKVGRAPLVYHGVVIHGRYVR